MPNGMYGGVRGRKTKVGRKLLRFPPTRIICTTGELVFDTTYPNIIGNYYIYRCSLSNAYDNRCNYCIQELLHVVYRMLTPLVCKPLQSNVQDVAQFYIRPIILLTTPTVQ